MVSLFITGICVVFTSCSQFPGTDILSSASLPLSDGFSKMFNISMSQAMWLSFPALYGNFYGFVWAYGRQLSSMAKSGLLPEMLGEMTQTTDTPYVALFVGLLLSFGLALLCFYADAFYADFAFDVMRLYMLSSYVIYDFMFVSYIIFKFKYSSLTRSFNSPFGIYGAFLGLAVFALNSFGILVEMQSESYPFYLLLAATLFMAIYYFGYLEAKQHFSEEEKGQLFKAYLINANVKSRAAVKRRKRGSNVATNSASGNGSTQSKEDHSSNNGNHSANNNRDIKNVISFTGETLPAVGGRNTGAAMASSISPSKQKISPVKHHNNQIIPEVLPERDIELGTSSCKAAEEVQAAEPVVQHQLQHREVIMTSSVLAGEGGRDDNAEEFEDEQVVIRRTSFLAQASNNIVEWMAGTGLRMSGQALLFSGGGILPLPLQDASSPSASKDLQHQPHLLNNQY